MRLLELLVQQEGQVIHFLQEPLVIQVQRDLLVQRGEMVPRQIRVKPALQVLQVLLVVQVLQVLLDVQVLQVLLDVQVLQVLQVQRVLQAIQVQQDLMGLVIQDLQVLPDKLGQRVIPVRQKSVVK